LREAFCSVVFIRFITRIGWAFINDKHLYRYAFIASQQLPVISQSVHSLLRQKQLTAL